MQRLNVFIQEGVGGDVRLRTIADESQMKAVALQVAQKAVENHFQPVVLGSIQGSLNAIKEILKQYKTPTAGKANIYQLEPVRALLRRLETRMTPEAKEFDDMLAAYYGRETARSHTSLAQVNHTDNVNHVIIHNTVRDSLAEHIQALVAVGLITVDDLFSIAVEIEASYALPD
ncbi:hypothetical protein ABT061_18635 [Streptosporangium sp. NPDC002544]|uniref:hypothetical protein n=1 Tax=Streptosporangium sp. NPDC002544 TaxID=3154538 RepID=UPI0033267028